MNLIYVLVAIAYFSNQDPQIVTADFKFLDACHQAGEDFLVVLGNSDVTPDDLHIACLPTVEI